MILITGHEGFIGKQLYDRLSHKHPVIGFDCGTDYYEWIHQYSNLKESLHKPPSLIIHCGAISDSRAEGKRVFDLNYRATKRLIDDAYGWVSKFIFLSSCTAKDPQTDYGRSKRVGEDYLFAKLSPSQICCLRLFNIWGDDEKSKVSPSIVHKLIHNELRVAYEDCIRDFVHVFDLVTEIRKLVDDDKWQPGLWEVGTCIPTNIHKLAQHCHAYESSISMPKSEPAPMVIPRELVAEPGRRLPNMKLVGIWDRINTAIDQVWGVCANEAGL